MTVRPSDWSPLAASDPCPGDPDTVHDLAMTYRHTALEIEAQARRLQRISDVDDWKGEAAEKFREAAGDLAEQLAKSQQRYAEVQSAVQAWVHPLRVAQQKSADALAAAKDAERHMNATAGNLLDGVKDPTDAQKQAQSDRAKAHGAATSALDKARQDLHNAVSDLDEAAKRVAKDIKAAAEHDKDSRWDKIKGFVSDHAKFLKIVAEIAGWVATIAAVAALLITSPLWAPILAGIALVATVVALAVHSALASAGEGSWTDVAIDVVALATFGVGKIAMSGVRAGGQSVRAVVAAEESARAVEGIRDGARFLDLAEWAMRTRIPLGPLRIPAGVYAGLTEARAVAAGEQAAQRVLTAPLPEVSRIAALRAGDREAAEFAADLARHAPRITPEMLAAQEQRIARAIATFRFGTGLDVLDKADGLQSRISDFSIKPDIRYEIPDIHIPLAPVMPFPYVAGRP